ncbi:LytR/AlgR family response regulator transcription factor [Runella salmonicolor]|uniref:LytTR family transcriptional regulator DNA-binding domain-containing protein n=1 Tax=Runella salmonicolor TaxID=2950278 RepID=A0ABT1FLR5_9BACT|nr:LytTR family transcriptional regulator DNA-binding domain-containing protein [Runella salmonicolor]MCP1382696.1 LytTR family transcriptional regulator DNA-binding domain-containing protein [Runella salmonicolor]
MKTLRTIIADDSEPQLNAICRELKMFCPQVNIVAKTLTLDDTALAIKTYDPELLLLDVEFHYDETSFNLIEQCRSEGDIRFQLIFMSGHAREKNYATLAADYSALQCLQKPIDPQKLKEAVLKAEAWFAYQEVKGQQEAIKIYNQQVELMTKLLKTKDFRQPFFVRSVRSQWINLDPKEVLYLESDGKQTIFYLTDKRQVVGMELIGFYEFLSENYSFLRVHQSYIVNLDNMSLFHSQENYVRMSDGKVISPSRQGATLLRERFSQQYAPLPKTTD